MKALTKENLINAIRWATFIPAAVLGAYLLSLLFGILIKSGLVWLIDFFNVAKWINGIIMLINSIVYGVSFIGIGVSVVPKGKKVVSYVLFGILCVLNVATIISNYFIDLGYGWFLLISSCICSLIGAGGTLSLFRKYDFNNK